MSWGIVVYPLLVKVELAISIPYFIWFGHDVVNVQTMYVHLCPSLRRKQAQQIAPQPA